MSNLLFLDIYGSSGQVTGTGTGGTGISPIFLANWMGCQYYLIVRTVWHKNLMATLLKGVGVCQQSSYVFFQGSLTEGEGSVQLTSLYLLV
jgi:hypothetical protein